MLDGIRTSYSISDLEQLTGISAHSIRIWERRYALLDPLRTEGNVRRYSNDDLKKLLNISALLKTGAKISDLAAFTTDELSVQVNARIPKEGNYEFILQELKMAMLDFDSYRFEDIYTRLISRMTFYEVFNRILLPFLEEIGHLWQINAITVAHEHYVSNLLRQKLFFQIELLPAPPRDSRLTYILFLPLGELHELGLLFLHYALRLHQHDSIYLGPNVDLDTLKGLPGTKKVFIAYLTFAPAEEQVHAYLKDIRTKVAGKNDQIMAVGAKVRDFRKPAQWSNVEVFSSIDKILSTIRI